MNNQEIKINKQDLEVIERHLNYYEDKTILIDITGSIETIIEYDKFYYSLTGQEIVLHSPIEEQSLTIKLDKINKIDYESNEPNIDFNSIELFLDDINIRIWTEE